jgi:hypothetical protein
MNKYSVFLFIAIVIVMAGCSVTPIKMDGARRVGSNAEFSQCIMDAQRKALSGSGWWNPMRVFSQKKAQEECVKKYSK